LSGALRGEPTEQPQGWRGDVVAVAKRELTVWGKLAPAEHSLAHGALSVALRPHPCRCRRRASAPGAGACVIFRAASRAGARTQRRRGSVGAERCANLCFGGRKRNRLFMAASQSVYSVYVNTQGVAGG